MYRVQTLNKISPLGLERFDRAQYTWGDDLENPDAILVRSASMHDTELGSSVKAIARAGAGVNNIPLDKCSQAGIVVFNTPGANANAVKELVVLGLLMSSRKIAPAMEWIMTLKGKGDEVPKLVEKGKGQFVGPEIMGKSLGVIGLGAIGAQVANTAAALGMKVYGYDPYISVDAAWRMDSAIIHAKSLKDIYESCDYITLHLPCTSETKGMINASSIQMMKTGVRILNFARGELVESADMLAALDEKQVKVYVTDFADDVLLGHKGVVALPHLGASTPESEDNCAMMAVDELMEYLETGNITNSVNLPSLSLPMGKAGRLCIIHKNVSGMLSKMAAVLSEAGCNIENMINDSKKDYAYTIMNLGQNVDADIAEKLAAVPDVIRVRVL
ncbi:MAG TPA: phosphoglycerate dehydrogenase [Candidatus Merdivicinus intestinavium]|nr:phosphoglycerate dehydrogenase [Candidatus Merdivicinus intestinavium]